MRPLLTQTHGSHSLFGSLAEIAGEGRALTRLARAGELRRVLRHGLRSDASYNIDRGLIRSIPTTAGIPRRRLQDIAPVCDLDVHGFRYYDNSMPLADLAALLTLAISCAPARVLEIGTSDGLTAASIARVVPRASVVTLDIQREVVESAQQVTLPWGSQLTVVRSRRMGAEILVDDQLRERVRFIQVDSVVWQPDGAYDFIVIDGAHDYESVAADSEMALNIVNPGGLIAWHDFDLSPGAADVPRFLIELAQTYELVHIDGTSIVVFGAPAAPFAEAGAAGVVSSSPDDRPQP